MVPRQYRRRLGAGFVETSAGETGSAVSPLRAWSTIRGPLAGLLRPLAGSLVTGLPVALLLLLVIYPLGAIIIQSVLPQLFALNPSLTPSLIALQQVFAHKASYKAITASTSIALATMLLASALGITLAIFVQRTTMPGRRLIEPLIWIVFFTPSFLLGEAWSIFMTRGGTLDQFIHLPDSVIKTFFSPLGVILLLSLKSFPFVYFAVSAGLTWLGSEYEDAARMGGAPPWQCWLRINIPLLLPAIASGALIVFAEALSDFGTAATIAQNAQVTLVTYQIYEAINTFPVDFPQAAALSLLLFAAIALALIGQGQLSRQRSYQIISGRTHAPHRLDLGPWRWAALAFTCAIMVLALVIPLGECVLLSFQHAFGNGVTRANLTLVNYQLAVASGSDDRTSLMLSLWLSLAAATIVMTLGLPISYLITRSHIPGRRALSFITLVTISVPGIILACGYIFAWNSPYLWNIGIGGPGQIRFYGTVWILLAAYVGGALPYAIRLSGGALQQVSDSLLDAGRAHGAGLGRTLRGIIAPLLRSSLTSIWILVFTGAMFELSASELLYPPGHPTMPVRIESYFGNFRIEQGMAVAMLNVSLVAAAIGAVYLIPWIWGVWGRVSQAVQTAREESQ